MADLAHLMDMTDHLVRPNVGPSRAGVTNQ